MVVGTDLTEFGPLSGLETGPETNFYDKPVGTLSI